MLNLNPFSKIGWLPMMPTQFRCKVSRMVTSPSNPHNLGSTSPCLFFFFPRSQFRLIVLHSRSQNFLINCDSCPGSADIADNCKITHVETGLCVADKGNGTTLALVACGTGASQYNFRSPWFIGHFFSWLVALAWTILVIICFIFIYIVYP